MVKQRGVARASVRPEAGTSHLAGPSAVDFGAISAAGRGPGRSGRFRGAGSLLYYLSDNVQATTLSLSVQRGKADTVFNIAEMPDRPFSFLQGRSTKNLVAWPSTARWSKFSLRISALNAPWTDTGIKLVQGQPFSVAASGQMNWYTEGCPGSGANCTVTPQGRSWSVCEKFGDGFIAPDIDCWSVIGKIGDGPVFEVGSSLDNFSGNSFIEFWRLRLQLLLDGGQS